jgi:ribonuclease HI
MCYVEHEFNDNKYIFIMSDRQFRVVRADAFNSKLVAERLDALKRLTFKFKLTLMRVSGHTDIARNKIADQLASKGSEARFIGLEPFFGFNNAKYKKS